MGPFPPPSCFPGLATCSTQLPLPRASQDDLRAGRSCCQDPWDTWGHPGLVGLCPWVLPFLPMGPLPRTASAAPGGSRSPSLFTLRGDRPAGCHQPLHLLLQGPAPRRSWRAQDSGGPSCHPAQPSERVLVVTRALSLAAGTQPWLLRRSSCCWLKTGSEGSRPPGAQPRSPRTAFFPCENTSSVFLRTHFLSINESLYGDKDFSCSFPPAVSFLLELLFRWRGSECL